MTQLKIQPDHGFIAKLKPRQRGQHEALTAWGYKPFAIADTEDKDLNGVYYRLERKVLGKPDVKLARLTNQGAVQHLN